MSKTKDMFNIFLNVLKNKEQAIKLVIPKSYVKNIYEIDYKSLLKKGYKNLIFDIDNTIMPVGDIHVSKDLISFFERLKKDFTICIVSNNEEKRVNPVREKLKVKAIANANKPEKEAYLKIKEEINIKESNTVMIGDQMLTDVVFANRYNLYSVLVEPYKKKYDLKTGTSRVLQNIMMKKLKQKIKRYHYY